MLSAFVSVKVVSVIIGPSGVALLGQLSNFTSIILSFASGGINSGVTKYIAANSDNEEKIKDLIGTAFRITLFLSFIIGTILISFSSYFSNYVLLSDTYKYVFQIFGLTLFLYSTNALLLSIVNGFKKYNLFVKISIFSSVFGLLISLLLVSFWGINGSLINVVTSQSLLCIINFIVLISEKCSWLSFNYLFAKFKLEIAKKYFRFTVMTLVSALTIPVSQLIIRSYLIKSFTMKTTGLWEGLNRLSLMYLLIITSSFGVYYLPKLSEISEPNELKKEIHNAFKVIIPFLSIILPLIYLSRNLIIKLLFSPDFYEMSELFSWQLIGDFLKVSSWLIAYVITAKAMTFLYIITEICTSLLNIFLVFIFCRFFGFTGVVIAYMVNYFIYFLTMFVCVYMQIGRNKKFACI